MNDNEHAAIPGSRRLAHLAWGAAVVVAMGIGYAAGSARGQPDSAGMTSGMVKYVPILRDTRTLQPFTRSPQTATQDHLWRVAAVLVFEGEKFCFDGTDVYIPSKLDRDEDYLCNFTTKAEEGFLPTIERLQGKRGAGQ
ncbi:MAG: hypothetical protein NTW19_07020 [Planctomycetota bacterium]|nr:hypothetical protein [Planctomycetota bacterium]